MKTKHVESCRIARLDGSSNLPGSTTQKQIIAVSDDLLFIFITDIENTLYDCFLFTQRVQKKSNLFKIFQPIFCSTFRGSNFNGYRLRRQLTKHKLIGSVISASELIIIILLSIQVSECFH